MREALTMAGRSRVVPTTFDERRLSEMAAQGDPALFERIVQDYRDSVAGLAYRLLGWPSDVDDVVQEVFVAVLQNLPKFRGESRLATWLFRITVNECRRHRRRSLLRLRLWPAASASVSLDRRAAAQRATIARETSQRVRAAVAALPRKYREVVVLRYLEELPIAEIGQILGLKQNAIEVRLSRARQQLRGVLAGLLED